LCPVSDMATERLTLARSKFRTAVRRKSWVIASTFATFAALPRVVPRLVRNLLAVVMEYPRCEFLAGHFSNGGAKFALDLERSAGNC